MEELLKLNDNEKIETYLQAFEYADYWNRIDILDNGKIKLRCECWERARTYTRKGIVKRFDEEIKQGCDFLEQIYWERQNGEKENYLKEGSC